MDKGNSKPTLKKPKHGILKKHSKEDNSGQLDFTDDQHIKFNEDELA